MDAVIKPGASGVATPQQGTAPREREATSHHDESVPAKIEAAKKPDDKINKVLEWIKAVGMPVVTLFVTIVGGYHFTNLSKEREAREGNERMYAQLLTQREQSDALIRKDMFGVVINRFLTDANKQDWNSKVLQLELLANNFNQSLDLAPLFKDLARQLSQNSELSSAELAPLKKRLDRTAANLILKQVNSLSRRGFVKEISLPLAGWDAALGKPFIDETIAKSRLVPATPYVPISEKDQIRFTVEVIDVNIERREVEIRLVANFPGGTEKDLDRHFWVGQYDFPMLDNTQLPYGLRASVVITDFFVPESQQDREANSFVHFHLVVFPGASASFKERQDYDDVLNDMLRAKGNVTRRESD
jgi:hypothetical protein